MARRRMTGRRRYPRRRLFWAHSTFASATVGDANLVRIGDLLADYQGGSDEPSRDDVEGITVTRIRGAMYWVPPATVAQEYHWLNVGIAVGNTSDMDELTDEQQVTRLADPYRDWMYYRRHATVTGAVDPGVNAQPDPWPTHFEIDLKSQRRFDEKSQSLFLFYGFPGGGLGTGNDYRIYTDLRILCKRP